MGLEKLFAGDESLVDYTDAQIDELGKEVLSSPTESQKENIKRIVKFFEIGKEREEGVNGRIFRFISIPEISVIVQELKKEASK
jgi:hypothetical protein